jgi:hypothetical protein
MPYQVASELRRKRSGPADGHESDPEHLQNAEMAYLELAERFNWLKIDCAPDGTLASLRKERDIADEVYWHVTRALRK